MTELLQSTLYWVAHENHLKVSTGPECTGAGSDGHASVCPCNTTVLQGIPAACIFLEKFKAVVITYKPLLDMGPDYLRDHLSPHVFYPSNVAGRFGMLQSLLIKQWEVYFICCNICFLEWDPIWILCDCHPIGVLYGLKDLVVSQVLRWMELLARNLWSVFLYRVTKSHLVLLCIVVSWFIILRTAQSHFEIKQTPKLKQTNITGTDYFDQ